MILRRLARPLLASTFIYGGVNALRHTEGLAQMAKPFVDKTIDTIGRDRLPDAVPTDPATLVRLDAVVKVVAGTALACGKLPRLSALALLGTLAPTTVAGHPFWEAEDPAERADRIVHFFKNAGLAGGLMIAAADTEGRPSLGWRARRAAKKASKKVSAD
jgi:putative oxidoreductase